MRLAIGLLSIAWLGAGGIEARADAIDCSKAELADEKAICAEPTLVEKDARMTALYANAMAVSGMGERGDLQDGQASWLERRHACKADLACLRAAYEARIGDLQKVIDATGHGPS